LLPVISDGASERSVGPRGRQTVGKLRPAVRPIQQPSSTSRVADGTVHVDIRHCRRVQHRPRAVDCHCVQTMRNFATKKLVRSKPGANRIRKRHERCLVHTVCTEPVNSSWSSDVSRRSQNLPPSSSIVIFPIGHLRTDLNRFYQITAMAFECMLVDVSGWVRTVPGIVALVA